jgi:rRNA processing protein Krr1/Pno1
MVCLINWCQIDYHCFLSAWVAVFSANGTEAGYVEIENDDNKITVIELVNCISMAERAADCIDSAIIILKEICAVSGLDIVECLGVAYDVISKRKGRIINGTFVKNLVLQ